jgi:hypothetical protein
MSQVLTPTVYTKLKSNFIDSCKMWLILCTSPWGLLNYNHAILREGGKENFHPLDETWTSLRC